MAIQGTFEGFSEIGNRQGFMETRTRANLKTFFDGKTVTEAADRDSAQHR